MLGLRLHQAGMCEWRGSHRGNKEETQILSAQGFSVSISDVHSKSHRKSKETSCSQRHDYSEEEMKCPICTLEAPAVCTCSKRWLQGWGRVPQPLPSATSLRDAWGLLLLCWVFFCLDIEKKKWLFVVGFEFLFRSCDYWTTLSWCFYSFSVTKKHKKGILK